LFPHFLRNLTPNFRLYLGDGDNNKKQNGPSTIQTQQNMKTKIISIIAFPLFVCAAAYAQGITWIPANPMNKARAFFTATKLLNGDVLVAGGYDGTIGPPIFPDAEIYNWQTGEWTLISPMNSARAAAVDVRLEDGRVLVIGGADADFNFLDSAEIYDPSTGTWSFTGSMNEPRFEDFTAVLLPGHKVLIAGGFGPPFNALNSAEIYDETTNTWTPTGSMNVARGEFATVVLHDGGVLAVGGVATDETPIASAEIYNPGTGIWTLTGSMSTARNDLALVVLQDGRVLAAGGGMGDEELPRYASAEIFDPHTGQWTPTSSMTSPRSETEHAVVRLPDGRVLVPGGHTAPHTPVSSADLYDPQTGTWSAAGFMSVLRAGHVAVLLNGNRGVLVMGGYSVEGGVSTTSVDIAVPTH
jgi:N-acetylneuraminic acid mutarotase